MQLAPGAPAPVQSTPTTCGSASLVVARALADPAFEAWLDGGDSDRTLPALLDAAPDGRFAAYEALVKARTTAPRGLAGLQMPWPGAPGTPPWGALHELVAAIGASPRDYRVAITRWMSPAERMTALQDAADRVSRSRPAIIYVGSPTMPRHVCLIARPDADVVVYEPSRGEVTAFDAEALAAGEQRLGGWPMVWLVIRPR